MLEIGERLMRSGLEQTMMGINTSQMEYILECGLNENSIYKEIVSVIYRKALDKMKAKKAKPDYIKIVVACAKHLKSGNSQDRAIVVEWAEKVCA